MNRFKSDEDIDPGQVATVTALGNIFSARSTTTTTTSNKEAWYNGNKNAIYAWLGFNPNILTMNRGLFNDISSNAHKNQKKESVENKLFATLIQKDRFF